MEGFPEIAIVMHLDSEPAMASSVRANRRRGRARQPAPQGAALNARRYCVAPTYRIIYTPQSIRRDAISDLVIPLRPLLCPLGCFLGRLRSGRGFGDHVDHDEIRQCPR